MPDPFLPTRQPLGPDPGASAGARHDSPAAVTGRGLPAGGETILVLEDDPALRELVATLLEIAGYTALCEGTAAAAMALAGRHTAAIDLLLTDVMIPGTSGPDLAARLTVLRPEARVLYMSGLPGEDIVRRQLLPPGVNLLEKPFTEERLLRKVREVLDRRA